MPTNRKVLVQSRITLLAKSLTDNGVVRDGINNDDLCELIHQALKSQTLGLYFVRPINATRRALATQGIKTPTVVDGGQSPDGEADHDRVPEPAR